VWDSSKRFEHDTALRRIGFITTLTFEGNYLVAFFVFTTFLNVDIFISITVKSGTVFYLYNCSYLCESRKHLWESAVLVTAFLFLFNTDFNSEAPGYCS